MIFLFFLIKCPVSLLGLHLRCYSECSEEDDRLSALVWTSSVLLTLNSDCLGSALARGVQQRACGILLSADEHVALFWIIPNASFIISGTFCWNSDCFQHFYPVFSLFLPLTSLSSLYCWRAQRLS